MSQTIRFRIAVCPDAMNSEQAKALSSFHVDIQCTEADIQSIDVPHGLEDFIGKFIEPGLAFLLDQFQQPYTDAEDLTQKMLANAPSCVLPRSIGFYLQKLEMMKGHCAA